MKSWSSKLAWYQVAVLVAATMLAVPGVGCTTLLGNDFTFSEESADEGGNDDPNQGGNGGGAGSTTGQAGNRVSHSGGGGSGGRSTGDDGPIAVDYDSDLLTTESGAQALFTVLLNDRPSQPVYLSLSTTNPKEGTVTPTNLVFTPDNWNAPQTVTVTGVDDDLPDGKQTYAIRFSPAASNDPNYGGRTVPDVPVINIDDETAGCTVNPLRGLFTSEAGGVDTFTVVLNSKPAADVTIEVSSSNADEGKPNPSTLTFTAENWGAPQSVRVTGVDDDAKDGPIAYKIVLSPASSEDSNYDGYDPDDVDVVNIDNETAGVTILPTGDLATTENGATATFTMALNVAPSHNVVIALSSSNPAEGTVTPTTFTFTPDNWKAPQTAIVTGIDDSVADGNQVYRIVTAPAESEDPDYKGLDPADEVVTNVDNDSPGVTVTTSGSIETTEGGGSAIFTIVLNSKPSANVTIDLSSSKPSEGMTSPGSVTFTPDNWSAPQTITVTGQNDDVADGDQRYSIRIAAAKSADPGYQGIDPLDIVVVNVDNDSPGITVTPTAGLMTSEKGESATFTVTLNSKPLEDVRIDLSSSNGGEGSVSPTRLVFTSTNYGAPQTVTVTGLDDSVADGNQPYNIITAPATSNDAKYNGRDAADVYVINRDDDSPGIVVAPATTLAKPLMTSERGETATFTVRLQSQPAADVSIALSSSSPKEGNVSPSNLTFTRSNWNALQTVTVTGQDDSVQDGAQPYRIMLAPAKTDDARYRGLQIPDVLVSNIDNDTAGIRMSTMGVLTTTEKNNGTANFSIVLNSQPAGMATVKINLSSSRTSEGTVNPSSVTFTASNWSASQLVIVMGVDDAVADGNQPYVIITEAASSTDPNYSGLNPSDVSMINIDDDSAGVSVAAGPRLTTTEAGGTATFSVRLNSQPLANVTIPITSSNTQEGAVAPATLTFTTANWNSPQLVTITGANDAVADGSQPYAIRIGVTSSSDAKYQGIDPADLDVINTDDDSAGIVVDHTADLITTEGGGTATFTVRLLSQPVANVSIPLSSSVRTEGTVSPTSLVFTPANWSTAQTVTVTGVDDQVADGRQPYTIVVSAPETTDQSYRVINPPDVSVQNDDNDSAGITVAADSNLSTTEAGGTATFTVRLNSQPFGSVTIPLSSSNPQEGAVSPAALTFTTADWNVAQTVTIAGLDDAVADGAQPYTIGFGALSSTDPSYAQLSPPVPIGVTNQDND